MKVVLFCGGSATPCQLNWWIPVYGIQPEKTMAFHPRYWSQAVRNSSRDYNYYTWNKESRRQDGELIYTPTAAGFPERPSLLATA